MVEFIPQTRTLNYYLGNEILTSRGLHTVCTCMVYQNFRVPGRQAAFLGMLISFNTSCKWEKYSTGRQRERVHAWVGPDACNNCIALHSSYLQACKPYISVTDILKCNGFSRVISLLLKSKPCVVQHSFAGVEPNRKYSRCDKLEKITLDMLPHHQLMWAMHYV